MTRNQENRLKDLITEIEEDSFNGGFEEGKKQGYNDALDDTEKETIG